MRLSSPLSLGLALGLAAGVLALAPAASAAAEEPPTYTCQTDYPAPRIYPPWIEGVDCQASNGAPPYGSAHGPVTMIIVRPRFSPPVAAWTCSQAQVLDNEGPSALRVRGVNCQPEQN